MKFEDILPDLRNGKRVRRPGWRKGLYMQLEGAVLWYRLGNKQEPASLWHGDVLAKDWNILKDLKSFPRVGDTPHAVSAAMGRGKLLTPDAKIS